MNKRNTFAIIALVCITSGYFVFYGEQRLAYSVQTRSKPIDSELNTSMKTPPTSLEQSLDFNQETSTASTTSEDQQVDVLNIGTSTLQTTPDPDFEVSSTVASTINPGTGNDRATQSTRKPERKNVLFLMADDMRPQLGASITDDDNPGLTSPKLYTPNFDKLIQKSIVFRRAYSQYSLCGPSRTSLLTGRRPDTTRVFSNWVYWRQAGGNFTTIPQFFKDNGYKTIGVGKIFHRGKSSNHDDPMSWSEPYLKSNFTDFFYDPPRLNASGWKSVTVQERKIIPLTDEIDVDTVIDRLKELAPKAKTGEEPFFLALGFRKPHISFICPKEFYDMYPLEKGHYMAEEEWKSPHVQWQFGVAEMDENGQRYIPGDIAKNLRRAYFACMSYVDYLLGKVMNELDNLGLSDSTVVSFMADHSYHLGENNHWGKYMPSEMANRIPMMLHIPGRTDSGIMTSSLVEAVDMFPTVVEAAGLGTVPQCPRNSSQIRVCTEGVSLLPLIDTPVADLKDEVYSQIYKGDRYTIYSVWTKRYRYTEYADIIREPDGNGTFNVHTQWDVAGFPTELYDHQFDMEERMNRTELPDYARIKRKLQGLLREQFTTVYGVPL